jgi:hypothetical protein
MDRFARQRLLSAVGDRGQERIAVAAFTAAADATLSSRVERQYLERAGARHFELESSAPTFVHAAELRHPAARDFAAGAWRALVQLKSVLEQIK